MKKRNVVLGIIVVILFIMFSGCEDAPTEEFASVDCRPDYINSNDDLGYKKRGDRCEGRIIEKVSIPDFDLISVTAGTRVANSPNPTQFTLKFYLPEPSKMDIEVQELKHNKNYLMSEVKPQFTWEAGWREYSWETAPIINKLYLTLNQLGAVASLKKPTPSYDEKWVSPVVFYEENKLPFNKVGNYSFFFKSYGKAWVNYFIYREGREEKLIKKDTLSYQNGNFEINWDSSKELEGAFKLKVECEFFGNTCPPEDETCLDNIKIVNFYHKPTIEE